MPVPSPTRPKSSKQASTAPAAGPRPGPLSVQLEGRHMFVSFGVVLAAIGSFAALWGPNFSSYVAPGATGKTYFIIGMVLALLLAAATLTRRRMLAGLAAMLLAVAPWGPEYFLQILVFAMGIWHLVQVARVTKASRRTGEERRLPVPEPVRSAFSRIARVATGPATPVAVAAQHRQPPARSKRYTPPSR